MSPTLPLILRDLGFLAYGGPIVAFAVLVGVRAHLPAITPVNLIRAYRSWGPGLGLSLGLCVFAALTANYLQHDGFSWSLDRPMELFAWAAFFSVWVSNIRLEIWTLDPLRMLDKDSEITDQAAYDSAADELGRHLTAHAFLVVLTLVLTRLAEL